MFYSYILVSLKNNLYYVGSCENFEKRLALHNKGLVKSTKIGVPWKMMYLEIHQTRSLARKKELTIKSWKKRSAIENFIKHFEN
ncbi:MAG: GIY-YIG nuclease family protein [Patescibacteria group bacterium]